MTSWDFSERAQAHLSQHTHMIYYSSQLIERDQQLGKFEEYLIDLDRWF
jgi:hypothetical protein